MIPSDQLNHEIKKDLNRGFVDREKFFEVQKKSNDSQ